MDESVGVRYCKIARLADEVHSRLHQEIVKLGFNTGEIQLLKPGDATYHLERDPSSNEYSLIGDWRNHKGRKLGMLIFHTNGSFFVEHDVVKPHPRKTGWFVEAVNAWGKGDDIRAEARLLPMPE